MSLVTDLLPLVDVGNDIAEGFGLHPTAVTIRLEQYAKPLEGDAAAQAPTDLVLSPRPPVRKLSAEKAALFGGGPLAAVGAVVADVYRIGPIAPTHASGGYSLAQLLPAPADPSQRAVVLLDGPDTGGIAVCTVVEADASDPLGTYLTVRRTAKVA